MTPSAHSPLPSRSLRTFLRAAGRRRRAQGLGSFAPLRRLEGPRRHREPRLRRPAPQGFRRVDHGRGRAPCGPPRHAEAPARAWTPRRSRALFSGERFAPAPLTDERARAGSSRHARRTRRRPSRAISPSGSSRSLARRLRRRPRAGNAGARDPRAARPAREHAQGRPREEVHDGLAHLAPSRRRTRRSACASLPGEDGRGPAVQAEPEFLKGWIEIQDEGSQLAALLSGVKPGEQVVDLCAGGGGKTLALAAMMDNHGQIYATDNDARRLAPIHERLTRAGARNVQIRTPRGRADAVADSRRQDGLRASSTRPAPAPAPGGATRMPKWRLRPGSLEVRRKEQDDGARPRGAAREAGRADRLHHLLGAAGGE